MFVGFDSLPGVNYIVQTKTALGAAWTSASTVPGTGLHLEVPINIDTDTRFMRLTGP